MAIDKQCYYTTLGVPKGANEAEVKKAYRKLAKQWHPDKVSDPAKKEAASEKFKNISEAYDVLSDKERREVYDLHGHAGLQGGMPPGGAAGAGPHDHNVFFTSGGHGSGRSPEEIFREFFGSDDNGRGTSRSPFAGFSFSGMPGMGGLGGFQSSSSPFGHQQQVKPQQVKRKLVCTLEELYAGFSKKLKITKKIQDSQSGAVTTVSSLVTVEGRPGWKAGTKITFAGAGDELAGKPQQDIVFEVHEKPHKTFTRKGDDLETTVRVSLKEGLCGTTVHLTDLSGMPITLDMPRITPDTTRTLTGRGMPKKSGGHGALTVRFKIDFPALSADQKSAIGHIL